MLARDDGFTLTDILYASNFFAWSFAPAAAARRAGAGHVALAAIVVVGVIVGGCQTWGLWKLAAFIVAREAKFKPWVYSLGCLTGCLLPLPSMFVAIVVSEFF